jgi:peptidoglycan/xylan/chitin deacetylase (PgdA/CDA1 family)
MTMTHPLTIVMYHYVRDIRRSAYSAVKGLEIEQFRGQLDYIVKYYRPISTEQLLQSIDSGKPLPERAVLLHFDDGYRDHIDNVAPELERRRIKGAFFPIGRAALDRRVILANKVQFILAAGQDVDKLVGELEDSVVARGRGRDLPNLATYRQAHFKPSRIDSAPVIYIKRMLQLGLPPDLADDIATSLFQRYVTQDETAFADELYMSLSDLKRLREAGHHIGCHTDRHPWLTSLGRAAQRVEIVTALRLHDALGLDRSGFTFCYPYGGYNDNAISVLDELGCAAAFTADVALADPNRRTRLKLPRLDTIDLPMRAQAALNPWTLKATGASVN